MIVYEVNVLEDPAVERMRKSVLEAMEPMHLIHQYRNVDELRAFLDQGLEDMRLAKLSGQIPAEMPIALTRCWLFYIDPAAVDVVSCRMATNGDFQRWVQPDAWSGFFDRIEELRAVARRYNPQFVPTCV